MDIAAVPAAWQTAFTAICSNRIGVVKTTTKVTLQPYETRIVTGLVRKNFNADAALTEPAEDEQTARVTVCPRIVRTDRPGNIARIPFRLCNVSGRIVTIQPKESICYVEQVKVFNRDPVKDLTVADKGADEQDDTKAVGVDNKLDSNLEVATLTPDQKEHVIEFLFGWNRVFSQGPTDLGRTNLVEHEIHLTDEHPFKEPFRKTPPALVEEVR